MIDFHQPRECIYHGGQPQHCPRCGSAVQESYQTCVIATRRHRQIADSLLMGGDDLRWFCTNCPTFVIGSVQIGTMLQYGRARRRVGDEFAVMGIVDLEVILPAKRHLPFGDDNPIPLIEFGPSGQTLSVDARRQSKVRLKKRRKR